MNKVKTLKSKLLSALKAPVKIADNLAKLSRHAVNDLINYNILGFMVSFLIALVTLHLLVFVSCLTPIVLVPLAMVQIIDTLNSLKSNFARYLLLLQLGVEVMWLLCLH